jgi:ribonucleoside-diphosphate reductase beta chain
LRHLNPEETISDKARAMNKPTASNVRTLPGLLTPSAAYKPFRYPWAYDFWKRQQQVHWMPEEVPLGEDLKDWATKLNDKERNLLTQIFRFFTQSDVEVNDNYMERYARVFKPTEVKMMLAAFSNMETIHIAAYALLLETIGMPDSEFTAFLEFQAMRDKHDYMQRFGVETNADIARTLAMFGGFTEGLQLFASFAMLMNFPRHNKMKGMGQIVSWSVRDESLHCEGIVKLYHAFNAETGAVTKSVGDDIIDCCKTVVGLEDKFIDLAFEAGEIEGMTPDDIKKYIRFIADWRLRQLQLPEVYGAKENPLPWLQSMLSGVEHANFFEARSTEYSKAATRGQWHGNDGVWAAFEKMQVNKAANEMPAE